MHLFTQVENPNLMGADQNEIFEKHLNLVFLGIFQGILKLHANIEEQFWHKYSEQKANRLSIFTNIVNVTNVVLVTLVPMII